MPDVFIAMSHLPDLDGIRESIHRAVMDAALECGVSFRTANAFDGTDFGVGSIIDRIFEQIENADILIAVIGKSHENVTYEVGFADALGKPVVLVAYDQRDIPFDLNQRRVIVSDGLADASAVTSRLRDALVAAQRNPARYIARAQRSENIVHVPSAFISYSHADRKCLDRLQVHLRPLVRDGLLDVWADTQIKAGEDWEAAISAALERAAIAVLMISADFLASDFIVNDELPPLLLAAQEKGTVILPLILKPCRFVRERHLSRFQAINPPSQPLLKLDEMSQEELYVRVADRVELEIRSRST